jgi:hypothetical protein
MGGYIRTNLIMNIIITIIAVASGDIGGYLFEKMTACVTQEHK